MSWAPKFLLFCIILTSRHFVFAVDLKVQPKTKSLSLQFTGQESWDYQVQLDKGTLKLHIPKLSEGSVKILQDLKDSRVRFVKIDTKLSSRNDIVTLQLADGSDYFDYVLQKPSQLVVDIYQKNTPVKAEKKPEAKGPKMASSNKKVNRNPSNTDILSIAQQLGSPDSSQSLNPEFNMGSPLVTQVSGLFDASDPGFNRFRIAKSEIEPDPLLKFYLGEYIDYPFLDERLTVLARMKENMPEYQIKEEADPELRENERDRAKLLLTLFNRNRHLTFFKTAAWFEKTYPKSKYEEIIRAMWADTHYKVYLSNPLKNRNHLDLAKSRYEELIEKFPASQLIPRLQIFMGFSSIEDRDYISALRWFQRFSKQFTTSEVLDVAKLGVIRALVNTNQVTEAIQAISDIKKTTCLKSIPCQIKADLLHADIHINSKSWNEAEKILSKMSQEYGSELKQEERYFYNYGSVLFGQRNFSKALDMYLDFIRFYPNDSFAGYALTRVGEIIDINSTNANQALGAYLEANFRYGTMPGSTALFARIRLLEKQLPLLQGRARQVAITEIMDLSKKAKLPLSEDFGNFIVSAQLEKMGEHDEALKILVPIYRDNPTHPLVNQYLSKIQNIQARKMWNLSKESPLEALKYHELMQIDWLKNSKRIDVTTAIADSYVNLGDYLSAKKYYQKAIEESEAFDLTSIENRVHFMRQDPLPLSRLILKLAETQRTLNLWGELAQTIEKLDKHMDVLSQDEKIRRAALIAQLLKEKGQSDYAIRYLKDMRGLASVTDDREVDLMVKELQAFKKNRDHKSILELSPRLLTSCDSHRNQEICYQSGRDILVSQKEIASEKEYLIALEKFISQYEDYANVDDLRYELGQKYLQSKDINKAEKIWRNFKDAKSGWAKLAESDLEGVRFDREYQDYFKKIPQLSGSNESSQEKLNE